MQTNADFQPILLGSDINVYGMARAFHEAYGITSLAYAHFPLTPTKYSSIVSVTIVEHFDHVDTFRAYMLSLGKKLRSEHPGRKNLLIPCGDVYATLLAECRNDLRDYFVFNTLDIDLSLQLSNKASFYELCEKYGLEHPKTLVLRKSDMDAGVYKNLPFGFPVAAKPANSVEYLDIEFEGRKKAYITPEELEKVLKAIYGAGYTSEMIIQDFIPGDDSNMRVLNAYVDRHHRVRMMFLGHPLLEDPTPAAIGNYAAILPDDVSLVAEPIKKFLEDIHYEGVANFDMKYDRRDGRYKLFEINLRQGRSSYFVTLNGYNLATYFADDLVYDSAFDGATVYGHGDKLWLEVPHSIFRKYVRQSPQKDRALEMLRSGNWGTTLEYRKDLSFLRWLQIRYTYHIYKRNYKQSFAWKQD
jgi:D-aspartate ligase